MSRPLTLWILAAVASALMVNVSAFEQWAEEVVSDSVRIFQAPTVKATAREIRQKKREAIAKAKAARERKKKREAARKARQEAALRLQEERQRQAAASTPTSASSWMQPSPAAQSPASSSSPSPAPASSSQPSPAASEQSSSSGSSNPAPAQSSTQTLRAMGAYMSPAGMENSEFILSVTDGKITSVDISGKSSNGTSLAYQNSFLSATSGSIVGKTLTEAMGVDRIGGASLTTDGFRTALRSLGG